MHCENYVEDGSEALSESEERIEVLLESEEGTDAL